MGRDELEIPAFEVVGKPITAETLLKIASVFTDLSEKMRTGKFVYQSGGIALSGDGETFVTISTNLCLGTPKVTH
jgi:hypothetical protein